MAAETAMGSPVAEYPRMVMSETELSVICKNCGSEVSPYVTECPYCGARLRKRAPKLERRGDALEAQRPKRRRRRLKLRRPGRPSAPSFSISDQRPYATLTIILGSAILLLVQKATGDSLSTFGGLIVPFGDEWWRYLTAPFAYVDVGYLFVVAVGLAIFATGVERRLGSAPTALLLLACGALGVLAAGGIASAKGDITVIAGGNGMALGGVAAWFAMRRSGSRSPPRCWSRCRSSPRPRTSSPPWSAAPSAASPGWRPRLCTTRNRCRT